MVVLGESDGGSGAGFTGVSPIRSETIQLRASTRLLRMK